MFYQTACIIYLSSFKPAWWTFTESGLEILEILVALKNNLSILACYAESLIPSLYTG